MPSELGHDPTGPGGSPTALPGPRRGPGRRLNRVPSAICIGAGMLVAASFAYTLHERAAEESLRRHIAEARPQSADADAILKDAPAGAIAPVTFHLAPPMSLPPAAPAAPKSTSATASPQDDNGREAARKKAWAAYWQKQAELTAARFDKRKQALPAKTSIDLGQAKAEVASAAPATTARESPAPRSAAGLPGRGGFAGLPDYGGLPGFGFGSPSLGSAGIDTAGQQQKVAWMNQAGATGQGDVLPRTRTPAPSPYMLMAGSFIRAKLINGANSDMLGQIVGMIDQNVYDSAGHAACPLIPQGAKLIGTYNTSVSAGQDRLPFAWQRIIYPDNSSVDVGRMPGADQSGTAGASDEVDHHLWGKLGNALLISIAGSAAQLSQPQAVVGGTYNAQQVAAAALGQQFGQLGAQYGEQGLSIPNTIQIRPGYRFTLEVTKDIALPPWPCGGQTAPAMPIMTLDDR